MPISNATHHTPSQLIDELRAIKVALRLQAEHADQEFLAHADARAVQGGQSSEQAGQFRAAMRSLNEAIIALKMVGG